MENDAMKKRNRRQNIISAAILVGGTLLAYVLLGPDRPTTQETPLPEEEKAPISVGVQSVKESAVLNQTLEYPATVAGDQEIEVRAKTGGTAVRVNFDLGKKVAAGTLLAKIDDTGNNLSVGDSGFRSSQVQQSELSVEQAEEMLELAEKVYKNLKDAYDDQKENPALPQTVSKAQVTAAKRQIEIAEIQLENAEVGLDGELDDHLITAPVAGTITQRFIAAGDSVSVGEPIATISRTDRLKIRFYANEEELRNFPIGKIISFQDNQGNVSEGKVANISPQADLVSKRFLVEALPQSKSALKIGTVITVQAENAVYPQKEGAIIVPLSSVTVGQNESYIFILGEGSRALKVPVAIERISGENAEISAALSPADRIIVRGSKLVQDGDPVKIE